MRTVAAPHPPLDARARRLDLLDRRGLHDHRGGRRLRAGGEDRQRGVGRHERLLLAHRGVGREHADDDAWAAEKEHGVADERRCRASRRELGGEGRVDDDGERALVVAIEATGGEPQLAHRPDRRLRTDEERHARRGVAPRRREHRAAHEQRRRRPRTGDDAQRVRVGGSEHHRVGERERLPLHHAEAQRPDHDHLEVGRALDLQPAVALDAVAEREDRYERRDAHDDAERREEGAERVRAERVEADAERRGEDGAIHGGVGGVSASYACLIASVSPEPLRLVLIPSFHMRARSRPLRFAV